MAFYIRCLLGPRLYRLHGNGNQGGRAYEGNFLESFTDGLIKTAMFSISMAWSFSVYTCPVTAAWIYRRGYFTAEYLHAIGRLAGAVAFVLFSTFCFRGIGRIMNSDYTRFLGVLEAYKQTRTRDLKHELSKFDFDFREWPIDFRWNDSSADVTRQLIFAEKHSSKRSTMLEKIQSIPCSIISYLAVHTFGRRMIYPGSVSLMNILLSPVLHKGRAKLIEELNGERFKLLTRDNNEIDSVVVDRRNDANYPNGNTLVICCEGNSGFYEFGITITPLQAGYSVLGWNHPGFSGSTGVPFPDQEINAIDVVMQFAIHKLGFRPENIVVYAWSIGGFTATWAAMNYPNIKGLVLDATFDDLVYLAVARMVPSWKPLVVRTIRDYMDLNNAAQLCKYNGPVRLIRRTSDEMISTRPSRSIQTNRGNDLLIRLLQCRYPKLVTEETLWALNDWLSGDKNHQTVLWAQQEVEEEFCETTITSYIAEHSASYPMLIGEDMPNDMKIQLVLYLAYKYMTDFDSTHCIPLPPQMFHLPWDPLNITRNHCDIQQDLCT